MKIDERTSINNEAKELGKIDPAEFALKNPFKWPSIFLSKVISAYKFQQKLAGKLPLWAATNGILAVEALNLEQCSSQIAAEYTFQKFQGEKSLDLTGGYGVDSFFMSKQFRQHHYCEPNEELSEIVKHNFEQLKVQNVTFHLVKAEDFVNNSNEKFDLIYLDPDRRSETNQKLFLLEDCKPNILEILPKLLTKAEKVLIKLSPMVDLKVLTEKLPSINQIEVLSIKNEVKEVLVTCVPGHIDEPKIICTNLKGNKNDSLSFTFTEERNAHAPIANPLKYLYEPNVSLLKAGAFKLTAERFGLSKLATNTHFYTNEKLVEDFPGRIWTIKEQCSPKSKTLNGKRCQVISKNYPLSVVQIRSKYRLVDGGDEFLIFTELANKQKIVLICDKT